MPYVPSRKLFKRIKNWFINQYRKRRNRYVVRDQVTNRYVDTIYAKNSKQVQRIFTKRLFKGKRGLYKRYTGNGIIIENKDWKEFLEE